MNIVRNENSTWPTSEAANQEDAPRGEGTRRRGQRI